MSAAITAPTPAAHLDALASDIKLRHTKAIYDIRSACAHLECYLPDAIKTAEEIGQDGRPLEALRSEQITEFFESLLYDLFAVGDGTGPGEERLTELNESAVALLHGFAHVLGLTVRVHIDWPASRLPGPFESPVELPTRGKRTDEGATCHA